MIITKTPMRLSLGGGGTDIESFYRKHGGFWVSAAIDKYIYVGVKPRFEKEISLHYSKIEEVDSVDSIQHDIMRESLRRFNVESHVEVSSLADLPAKSGMGSSGAFTVGLLNALSIFTRTPTPNLAEEAYDLEANVLHRATGKQDQYTATLGGCRVYMAACNGKVTYGAPMSLDGLDNRLRIYYTGLLRDADPMIRKVANNESSLEMIKTIGEKSWDKLNAQDWDGFGALLHEHWMVKKDMAKGMTSPALNNIYNEAMLSGAMGGKIIGAGGGGFFLFCLEDERRSQQLTRKMLSLGLPEVPFRFVDEGSTVIEV